MKFRLLIVFSLLQISLSQEYYAGNNFFYNYDLPRQNVPMQYVPQPVYIPDWSEGKYDLK